MVPTVGTSSIRLAVNRRNWVPGWLFDFKPCKRVHESKEKKVGTVLLEVFQEKRVLQKQADTPVPLENKEADRTFFDG